jgi:hypothetical protein
VGTVKISVEKHSKGIGVPECVRWDISVLAYNKLYIIITGQESLPS